MPAKCCRSHHGALGFQAVQMMIFILLPSILLSGFVFPFDGMPEIAQWIAEALPMTHFMRLIRGIVLRGAGLAELATELWWLGGLALFGHRRVSSRLGAAAWRQLQPRVGQARRDKTK